MKLFKLFFCFCFLAISCSSFADTPADERPTYKRTQINATYNGDLCPKVSSKKYHHHLVLIDTTTPLRSDQIDLIKQLVLSEAHLKQMVPYDKLTIMRLFLDVPIQNKPLFAKCRPRNGDPSSPYKIDKPNRLTESEKDLKPVFDKLFVDGVKKTLEEIANPQILPPKGSRVNTGSPIMEQLKEISRLLDIDFTKTSGYESRKLTIVSDLTQNTNRLPFYESCPNNTKCPSWEKFKKNSKYKLWAKQAIPNFGENIEVNVVYLSSNFDQNLDKQILEFWMDFFTDAGIGNFEFETETD